MDALPEAEAPYRLLMGHKVTETDEESLQASGRGRGRCVSAFLVVSVLFLFVAVAALAAGGMMVAMDLQAKLAAASPKFDTSELPGHSSYPDYKMQNFAFLQAKSSELKNSTMRWAPVSHGAGVSVGSNFLFNSEQHSLTAEQEGTYFMYIALNLTCTHRCNAGLLSVRVGDKLTCEVNLPAVADATPVSRKCWTVSQMNRQKLLMQMSVPEEGLLDWKLELNSSGFGMFLVG